MGYAWIPPLTFFVLPSQIFYSNSTLDDCFIICSFSTVVRISFDVKFVNLRDNSKLLILFSVFQVSDSVLLGNPMPVGTGMFHLLRESDPAVHRPSRPKTLFHKCKEFSAMPTL